jgi:hypothetical protein
LTTESHRLIAEKAQKEKELKARKEAEFQSKVDIKSKILLEVISEKCRKAARQGNYQAEVWRCDLKIVEDSAVMKIIQKECWGAGLKTQIINSVTAQNPTAASGGSDGDTTEEIKQNSLAAFGTQLRTVTQDDYLVRAMSLPSQYGSLAKIYAEPERLESLLPGESLSSTNLYVLAYDYNKKLKNASTSLKDNLKTYLSQYRIVNDTIKIRDGFVINIGVEFDIIVLPNYNNNDVLFKCISAVKDYFNIDNWQINEPIFLKDIYIMLDKIDGVQTVKTVHINNKVNGDYSKFAYDVIGANRDNIIYPSVDPMIFEVKYPDIDIKGRVVSL